MMSGTYNGCVGVAPKASRVGEALKKAKSLFGFRGSVEPG